MRPSRREINMCLRVYISSCQKYVVALLRQREHQGKCGLLGSRDVDFLYAEGSALGPSRRDGVGSIAFTYAVVMMSTTEGANISIT